MPRGWKIAPSNVTRIVVSREVAEGNPADPGNPTKRTNSSAFNINVPIVWSANTNEKGVIFQDGAVQGDRVFIKARLGGIYDTELGRDLIAGRIVKVVINYTYRPLMLIVDSFIDEDKLCDRIQTDFTQIYDSTSLGQPATLSWKQRITESTQRIHSYGSAFTVQYLNNGLDTSFKGTGSAHTWEVHNRYVDGTIGVEKTEDKQVTLLIRGDRL